MDQAGTWLFKEQDKSSETVSPSPNAPGNAHEFHLTLGQRCALKQSAVWSDCSPVGREAAAHSRVIDWINSLIPNRWIEYWCLVSPDHRRKTQSASTAWKFNPFDSPRNAVRVWSWESYIFKFNMISIWAAVVLIIEVLLNRTFASVSWLGI